MPFWREMRRRNVFKVGAAYAVVAWLLAQVVSIAFPALQLPEWTVTFVTAVLIIGFPIAIVLAWAYEVTPEGIKRTKHVPLTESITHVTGQRLNYVVTGLLVVAVAFMAVDNYWLRRDSGNAAELSGISDEPRESGVLANSVAVLPFENLSPDDDNAYFAAGIHESILNQLAKIRDLNVIARTSVLRYADADKAIPEIAAELNVETVMEGSVRYAGNSVRITAQLIDPATGAHLWSEEYDRELSDIFAIQSDIATRIAMALEAEFSLTEQALIEQRPTSSTEAYALYLRVIASTGQFSAFVAGADREALIDRAIELDPGFALAYALKAELLDSIDEARALEAARKALELDPNLGIAHAALGDIHRINWRGREARQAYDRAIELSPNDADVLKRYAMFNAFTGRREESLSGAQSALRLDPWSGSSHNVMAWVYHFSGDTEAAAVAARNAIELQPRSVLNRQLLGRIELSRGNLAEAAEQFRLAEPLLGNPSAQREEIRLELAYSYRLAGLADEALRVAREQEAVGINFERGAASIFYQLTLGDYEQVLKLLNAAVERRPPGWFYPPGILHIVANVWGDPMLDGPRFREVRSELSLD